MRSRWNDAEADQFKNSHLGMRAYTSRLLGQEEDLVLHGGGNTSVKVREPNLFWEDEDLIYVKGSGWDLATIREEGFAPVKIETLLKMAELDELDDMDMVKHQRAAMTDPSAPNPSVEAILHAIIPFTFVDHTHADAVVTISNSPNGAQRIKEIYGDKMLIVPYVMPGFVLAREVYRMTQDIDWNSIEGIILLNHGVFTFHDEARASYEKMIEVVTQAENYLETHISNHLEGSEKGTVAPLELAKIRKEVSQVWGKPVLAQQDNSAFSTAFSELPSLGSLVDKGPLTPDHIIRTKRVPVVLTENHAQNIKDYAQAYQEYFNAHTSGDLICLDPAPRWAVWPGHGVLSFGSNVKSNTIIQDIARHTVKAIYQANQLGGWEALSKKDLFEMEYWVLEQAKLKKGGSAKPMQGKIALVTGAAGGIGKACVERLVEEGAVVGALDIDPSIASAFTQDEVLALVCDVTDSHQLSEAVDQLVSHFGGLDLLVTNAGVFPESRTIAEMDETTWSKSLAINLTSHQQLMKLCLPYLSVGVDPAVVIIGSKNVAAPGPGAGAYSVAKAGLNQLGRVAALELGEKGIRVNMLHPNAVFDTGVWANDILKARAAHYKMTVEEYKANNLLKTEITSNDVAELAVQMLGKSFSKTTGAQVSIDGGNERTI